MSKTQLHVPDMLPVLSRGKHRNPHKGACFMELVSYLAGERWSDHPACTHSLLASVARLVNDHTSDEGRPHLAELIPSVIGLTGDDPHIDAMITLRCATIALDSVYSLSRSWSARECWHNSMGARRTVCLTTVSAPSAMCPMRRSGPTVSPVISIPVLRPSAGRQLRTLSSPPSRVPHTR